MNSRPFHKTRPDIQQIGNNCYSELQVARRNFYLRLSYVLFLSFSVLI